MKVNEERSQRDEIKRILDRAPWYLRLEARVIYAMLAIDENTHINPIASMA